MRLLSCDAETYVVCIHMHPYMRPRASPTSYIAGGNSLRGLTKLER